MFRSIRDQLLTSVSGTAAKQMVADISRYHRIQASPDYRQAAEMIYETLLAWGLEAQLLSYPANESTRFWGQAMFQEWSGVSGRLRLLAPAEHARTLADFRELRLALIPRSTPWEGEADLIVPRNKGEEPEDYEGLDVAGKIILTDGQIMRVHHLAVEERGAIGIIFDGMRTIDPVSPDWSLPDTVQYTSFWWWNTPRKAFGFALSPRDGRWLRRLIETTGSEEPVRVHVRVISRLYDGAMENVTATIPGETQDEILLVSHLCHPAPCANDNASGAAATMEVAHALHSLIDAGELARPRRTLRFLWMPEMTGTYAYLATQADRGTRTPMVAGLNLDMVGEDQDQCGSVMLFDSPPHANASFVIDLLERIRQDIFDQGSSFSHRGQFPLFRYATVPFSGGSDHYIFSDPTVGVPMPMLIQWPDRFYHTTADTLDRVSPATLERSSLLAGTYVYWLATAGTKEVIWLARELTARFKQRTIADLQDAVTAQMSGERDGGLPWQDRLAYWNERQLAAYQSLGRLHTSFDPRPWSRSASSFLAGEWVTFEESLGAPRSMHQTGDLEELASDERFKRVPHRRVPGPISVQSLARYSPGVSPDRLHKLANRYRAQGRILPTLALFWADGQRTVSEIARQVELESGEREPEAIADYFELLADLNMVEW